MVKEMRKYRKKKQRIFPYKGYELKSSKELIVAKNLTKQKLKWEYETEKITWLPPPTKLKTYTPDFIISGVEGKKIYVEYKEFLDTRSKQVLRYVSKQHPEIDLRILFGVKCARKKIRKGSNTTYGDWADRYRIRWGEGDSLPQEWLKEIQTNAKNN